MRHVLEGCSVCLLQGGYTAWGAGELEKHNDESGYDWGLLCLVI